MILHLELGESLRLSGPLTRFRSVFRQPLQLAGGVHNCNSELVARYAGCRGGAGGVENRLFLS